jgi:hypothetical protein
METIDDACGLFARTLNNAFTNISSVTVVAGEIVVNITDGNNNGIPGLFMGYPVQVNLNVP